MKQTAEKDSTSCFGGRSITFFAPVSLFWLAAPFCYLVWSTPGTAVYIFVIVIAVIWFNKFLAKLIHQIFSNVINFNRFELIKQFFINHLCLPSSIWMIVHKRYWYFQNILTEQHFFRNIAKNDKIIMLKESGAPNVKSILW